MANSQRPAANLNTSKRPSAGTQPKATASAKENNQLRSSMTTRPTLAPKPPQTRPFSSNGMNSKDSGMAGVKDAETAALLASLRAEIDQLKKLQAAKPKENKSEEIPRPTKITSLQDAMGLTENKKLYSYCRSVVRDVMLHAGLPIDVDWRNQDAVTIGKVAQVASSRNKQLQCYKGNWATIEIMKTLLKNRRSYRKRIGSPDQHEHDGEEGKGEKEGDGNNSDPDNIYADEENRAGIEGDEDINGGEDEGENGIDNGGDICIDDVELGGNADIELEGRKGGGSGRKLGFMSQADLSELDLDTREAGTKRKVTQDDEPAAATTTRAKRMKMDGSGGHQATTEAAKKVQPKRKNYRKKI